MGCKGCKRRREWIGKQVRRFLAWLGWRMCDEINIGYRVWVEHTKPPYFKVYTSKKEDPRPGAVYVPDFRYVPEDGILVVMLYRKGRAPDGNPLRTVRSGSEWYFYFVAVDGNWTIAPSDDSREEIEARYPGAVLRRGKSTSDALYARTLEDAMNSREF